MGEIIVVDGIKIPIGSHEGKTLVIGSDHRGFEYKNAIINYLEGDFVLIDVGTSSPERCDYPAISENIGSEIERDPYHTAGIGICGSGIGIIIPASKHNRVYGATCSTPEKAANSRRHNNTNLVGIGADEVDLETALDIVNSFLKTPFYSNEVDERTYLNRYIQTVAFENIK